MNRSKKISIAFILLGVLSGQATAEAQCPESAQKFWKSFRQVVLKDDKQKVARYVDFPFEIRGVLDSSDKRKVNRDDFLAKFPFLTTTDAGLSAKPSTMADLVKSTPNLTAASCSQSGNEFRVGTWRFELKSQGWRFVMAYIED